MSKENELVLCLDGVPPFVGVVEDYKFEADPKYMSFQRRGDCETDETKRQIIPYIIVLDEDEGNKLTVLTYKRGRQGNEERLHDLYTFGVGGHINTGDVVFNGSDTVMNAVFREIEEEIGLNSEDFSFISHIGWVALDSTPVDKVHLGKIYIAVIEKGSIPKIKPEAGAFEETKFMGLEELGALNLEGWSRAILPEIKKLITSKI